MSRREPDRKVHRFTSWRALFILKIEKVLEGSLAPSVVDSRYRMPLNCPPVIVLDVPNAWIIAVALPRQPLGLIIPNSMILHAVLRAITI
jgi:hypothetical protein